MGEGATDLAGIWSPEGRGLFAKDLQVELFASKHSREKAINMKRFLFSMAFTAGIAALAVVARIGHAQTAAGGNLVILTESSALGQQLARDVATNGASVVTLGPPVVVPRGRSSSLTAGIGSFTAGSSAGQRYFITDLGTLGGRQSFAYAINDLGQVVGESWISGDMSSHAFLYSNGKMTDLYPLNSQEVQTVGPTGINNSGEIASGVVYGGIYVPAIFNSRTGDLKILGSLGGVTSFGFNGVATSINRVGSAVGYSYLDGLLRHAFLYRQNAFSDIGSFGGYSAALAINDEGVIVGFASGLNNGTANAFVYADGVMADIHPTTESYARDINNRHPEEERNHDRFRAEEIADKGHGQEERNHDGPRAEEIADEGQVVGSFVTADQTATHGFVDSRASFTDLSPAGTGETVAFAINDHSQIVGITSTANGQHAFLYDKGVLEDLNALIQQGLGWELTWAFDINNRGQIVGYGILNNRFRAFLLTPAISPHQCQDDDWQSFGFTNQGQCFQFANTRE